jgi:hypothetical protein
VEFRHLRSFDRVKNGLKPGQVLQFKTADEAARRAALLAGKHAGVAA